MTAIADCTVAEKLLLAGHALEEAGQTPFSAEDLIVSAWKKYPESFGLKGYADQFPDSNKVLVALMGERGLAKRGWLSKMGQKLYSVSREGRQAARRLLNDEDVPPPRSSSNSRAASGLRLSRDQEKFLTGLLASSAVEKHTEDRKAELTFADACRFWGITENLSGNDLDDRLRSFKGGLLELDKVFLNEGEAVLQSGRSVSAEEIGRLDELNAMLEQRFSRHLTLLRNRTGRN